MPPAGRGSKIVRCRVTFHGVDAKTAAKPCAFSARRPFQGLMFLAVRAATLLGVWGNIESSVMQVSLQRFIPCFPTPRVST